MQENRALSDKIAELEAELQDTVAQGGEMFLEDQDSVKKELIKRYPLEDFSGIDDILLEEDEDEDRQDKERPTEENYSDPASDENVIAVDDTIIEDQEEATENVPLAL